jgi:hypothetical protein
METLQMIVQQGTARKPLTLLALVASRFYLAQSLLSFINTVLNATSKEPKRYLNFKLLERVIMRRLQKVPI